MYGNYCPGFPIPRPPISPGKQRYRNESRTKPQRNAESIKPTDKGNHGQSDEVPSGPEKGSSGLVRMLEKAASVIGEKARYTCYGCPDVFVGVARDDYYPSGALLKPLYPPMARRFARLPLNFALLPNAR